jgi:putative hydrolase of the HAD superfamily
MSSISTIFFDLDGTLYEDHTGVWELIGDRIEQFIREEVGIPARQVASLRQQYLSAYGTTLRGLHIHHQVDPDHYLRYVHDVPIEEYLAPNRALDGLLTQLPQRKWIFTNASEEHARRVIAALDLGPHFVGVLDVKGMGYNNKPHTSVYTQALELAAEPRPARTLFIDDRAENLTPAYDLGATTVLVGTREPHPAATHSILHLESLLEALPGLVE